MFLISSVLTLVTSKAKVYCQVISCIRKKKYKAPASGKRKKERKKFCILVRIWRRRGTSRIHLVPASADLIYLTFFTEFLPFSSLLVSLFLCFWGHFQFTWVLYPFGLAISPLKFIQFCRQQLGLVWNKHSLFQVALQANANAAFSRKPFPVPARIPPFATGIVAV